MSSGYSIVPIAYAAVNTAAFANVVDPVITQIIYPIVYFIFALGVLIFAYGVIEMIIKGSAEARETGRKHILFGVIGMFIMLSAWGIINFVSNTLFTIRGNATQGGSSQTIQSAPANNQPIQLQSNSSTINQPSVQYNSSSYSGSSNIKTNTPSLKQ